MHKIFTVKNKIFFFVFFVIVLALYTIVSVADEAYSAGDRPQLNNCHVTGYTNFFVYDGDPIPILELMALDMNIKRSRCRDDRMRFHKIRVNNENEFQHVRSFLENRRKDKYPSAWCVIEPKKKAYSVDLAYWYYKSIKKMNWREKRYNKGWIHKYAERKGCRVIGS